VYLSEWFEILWTSNEKVWKSIAILHNYLTQSLPLSIHFCTQCLRLLKKSFLWLFRKRNDYGIFTQAIEGLSIFIGMLVHRFPPFCNTSPYTTCQKRNCWQQNSIDRLIIVLRHAHEYFFYMETLPLLVKGCKILAYARRSWPLSRKDSLSCHTCCDTGPQFFRSHPKERPIQSPLTTHKGMWRIYSNPDPHGYKNRGCKVKLYLSQYIQS
jgi:hypothetical protein